jgi:hypothetical protein
VKVEMEFAPAVYTAGARKQGDAADGDQGNISDASFPLADARQIRRLELRLLLICLCSPSPGFAGAQRRCEVRPVEVENDRHSIVKRKRR